LSFNYTEKHSNLYSPTFGVSPPLLSAYSLSHQYVVAPATLQGVKFIVMSKPID